MNPVELVRARLEARSCSVAQDRGHAFEAQCPAHEDRNPSLSVSTGREGKALVKCHAGCRTEDVLSELGLTAAELFPEDSRPADDGWTVEAEYVYHDAGGREIFKVVRFTGKRFRQQRRTPGGWEWGMEGVTRQLFQLPKVLAAKERGDYIFLTEGEKDALAVQGAGYCATTMPGGAGKWERQYTEALTGAKVIILADDDDPGRQHAASVWRELAGRARGPWVRLPAEGCKDIADHLAAGHSLKGELREFAQLVDLPAAGPTNGRGRLAALTAAAFAARRGPERSLELLGPMFQRGMRTVVGAQTGEGKTTFALHAVHALVAREPFLGEERWRGRYDGARALVVDLEQGEETLKARLHDCGLADTERVDILWEPNGIALDKREEDRAMVRDQIREGNYDLVLLDPLYQLHLGSGNDEEVASATMRIIDGWAREFNCSIVIPMHARKPHPNAGRSFTIHDIAGTGTWLRNAEFVLGLQLMFAGESRLWFFKDRIGRGPTIRSHWWLNFDRDSGGYRRSHKEEKERVKKAMKTLLQRDVGATRAELLEVTGGNEVLVQEVLRGKHQRGEHYRTRKWPVSADQETLGVD